MPDTTRSPGRSRRRSGEAGSAYVAALLVLVVLTLVGLSLALITQSERQIGANERVQQRLFYAANSGIAASTARALTNADYTSTTYSFGDSGSAIAGLGFEVDVSPFYPILETACHLCEINQIGTYNEKAFRSINHAITVVALRRRGASAPLARKILTSMVLVQPWRQTPEAYDALTKPDELAKLNPNYY
jgi:hypothetical protein